MDLTLTTCVDRSTHSTSVVVEIPSAHLGRTLAQWVVLCKRSLEERTWDDGTACLPWLGTYGDSVVTKDNSGPGNHATQFMISNQCDGCEVRDQRSHQKPVDNCRGHFHMQRL